MFCSRWSIYSYPSGILNPLRAKFFRGNKNIYLHYMSFLHIDMTRRVVQFLPQVMPRSQMHPDEFPMCSRWVFWRNRPAALGCPAGRRVKIRRRERHRELLTRSYNFPDVGSLFGHRINILRWLAGHRQEADRPSVTSYGVRIDIGLTEPTPNIYGTRPMICRRPADDLPAPPNAGVMPARRRI